MIARQHLFLIIVAIFAAALIGTAIYYLLRAHRASKSTWAGILARLAPVDNRNIAMVALDLIDDQGNPRIGGIPELEPEAIWGLLGGLNGLEVLGANCDVLIDLAAYVQLWYPEALVVAEQLRLNAREIKWHIERLQGASQTGNLKSSFPDYAQRAAATYYLMTRRLLDLYASADLSTLTELQAAL
ncbi:MAG TPA: hypothetical protein VFC39_20380 [Acidobacteriaceae bacterium]|nr:hypothetical protein [Acidobacteriaceae bacterium]